jgi:hypothetical protein
MTLTCDGLASGISTWGAILIWLDNPYLAEGDDFLQATETLKPNQLGVSLLTLKQVSESENGNQSDCWNDC